MQKIRNAHSFNFHTLIARAQHVAVIGTARHRAVIVHVCHQPSLLGFSRFGWHVQLANDLTGHQANTGTQCAHGLLYVFELFGVRVAPDLCDQVQCHSVIVLAQPQAVFLAPSQVLSIFVEQLAVG